MKLHSRRLVHILKTNIGSIHTGIEVGVFRGRTSFTLLKHCKDLYLVMVDKYEKLEGDELLATRQFRNKSSEDMHEFMKEASNITFPYKERRCMLIGNSYDVGHLLRKNSYDFGFIDASHNYDSVTKDMNVYYELIRPGGLLLGHDYDTRGDRRGIYGVKKAVDEFGKKMNKKLHIDTVGKIWWYIK